MRIKAGYFRGGGNRNGFIFFRKRVRDRREGEIPAGLGPVRRNSDGEGVYRRVVVTRGRAVTGTAKADFNRGIGVPGAGVEPGRHRDVPGAAVFADAVRRKRERQAIDSRVVVPDRYRCRFHAEAVDGGCARDDDGFVGFMDEVVHRRQGEAGGSARLSRGNGQREVRHPIEVFGPRRARGHRDRERRGPRPRIAVQRGRYGNLGVAGVLRHRTRRYAQDGGVRGRALLFAFVVLGDSEGPRVGVRQAAGGYGRADRECLVRLDHIVVDRPEGDDVAEIPARGNGQGGSVRAEIAAGGVRLRR